MLCLALKKVVKLCHKKSCVFIWDGIFFSFCVCGLMCFKSTPQSTSCATKEMKGKDGWSELAVCLQWLTTV